MMDISALVDRYGSVPIMPKVAAHLLNELEHPVPDLAKVKRLTAADPGLTCRVLQVANAAGDRGPESTSSASDAVDILGAERLRALGQAIGAGPSFVAVPGLDLRQYWRISLNTAKRARSIARRTGVDPANAFTAGMLHAVGEAIMHLGIPQEMKQLDMRIPPFAIGRAKAERLALGFTYATVAAGFARKWRFPREVEIALRDQLRPFAGDTYEPLAGVVHIAAWCARAHDEKFTPSRYAAEFPYDVALLLGLDVDDVLGKDPSCRQPRERGGYLH